MQTYRLTFNDAPAITITASSPRRAAYKYAQTQGSLGMLNYITCHRVNGHRERIWEIGGTSGRTIFVRIDKAN